MLVAEKPTILTPTFALFIGLGLFIVPVCFAPISTLVVRTLGRTLEHWRAADDVKISVAEGTSLILLLLEIGVIFAVARIGQRLLSPV